MGKAKSETIVPFSMLDFDPNVYVYSSEPAEVAVPEVVDAESLSSLTSYINGLVANPDSFDSDKLDALFPTASKAVVGVKTTMLRQIIDEFSEVVQQKFAATAAQDRLLHLNGDLAEKSHQLLSTLKTVAPTTDVPEIDILRNSLTETTSHAYMQSLASARVPHRDCFELGCLQCRELARLMAAEPGPVEAAGSAVGVDIVGLVDAGFADAARQWQERARVPTQVKLEGDHTPILEKKSSLLRSVQFLLWFSVLCFFFTKLFTGHSFWNPYHAT